MGSIYPGDASPNNNIRPRIIRLANAEWASAGGRGVRFLDSTCHWCDIYDDFLVVDAHLGTYVSIKDVLAVLPEESRKRLLFN